LRRRREDEGKIEYYMPCMWSVIVALTTGFFIICGGVTMCVVGYTLEHISLMDAATAAAALADNNTLLNRYSITIDCKLLYRIMP
jgi:hypothetical protein